MPPDRAAALREAYRRNIMPPAQREAYEEAVRRRQVDDDYARGRIATRGSGAIAALGQTAGEMIPGVDEGGAALSVASDFITGRNRDIGDSWRRVRTFQDGQMDQVRQDHPVLTSAAETAGIAVQAIPLVRGVTAPIQGAQAATRGGRIAQGAQRVGGNAAAGGLVGGAQGLASRGNVEQRNRAGAAGATIGAAAGGAAPEVVRGVQAARQGAARRVANPPAPGPRQQLAQEGVRLTPGQMAGGFVQRLEDAATSIPGTGDIIRNARIRGIDDFDRATINRGLDEIGDQLPPGLVGEDAIAYSQEAFGRRYDELIPDRYVALDDAYWQDVATIAPEVQTLTQSSRQQLADILEQRLNGRIGPEGVLDGEQYQRVVGDIRWEARQFAASQDRDQQVLAQILDRHADSLESAAMRQDPEFRAGMTAANRGYAQQVIAEEAAASLGAQKGRYTPSQFRRAVRNQDRSTRHRRFAAGRALNQDIANAGREVLPSTVPDSGTPFRSIVTGNNLIGAGVGAAGSLPTAMVYNPATLNALNAAYRAVPNAERNALRMIANGATLEDLLAAGAIPTRNVLAIEAAQNQ